MLTHENDKTISPWKSWEEIRQEWEEKRRKMSREEWENYILGDPVPVDPEVPEKPAKK